MLPAFCEMTLTALSKLALIELICTATLAVLENVTTPAVVERLVSVEERAE